MYTATPAPAVDRRRGGLDDTLFSAPWFTDYAMREELRQKRVEAARPRGVRLRTVGLIVLGGLAMTPLAAITGAFAAVMVTMYG